MTVAHHLVDAGPFCEIPVKPKGKGALWFPNTDVTPDDLIIGALESAFFDMVKLRYYFLFCYVYEVGLNTLFVLSGRSY